MARAQEGGQSVGGALDPFVTGSILQGKQLAESRLIESMRQAGETERTKIAAGTQVQTTGMREAGETQRAAIQAAEADKRAAEQLKDNAMIREHQTAMVRLADQLASERERVEREYNEAIARGSKEDIEKWQKRVMGISLLQYTADRQDHEDAQGTISQMLDIVSKRNVDKVRSAQAMQDQVKAQRVNSTVYNQISNETIKDLQDNPSFYETPKEEELEARVRGRTAVSGVDIYFNNKMKDIGLLGVTADLFRPEGRDRLREMVETRKIGFGDILKVRAVIDAIDNTLAGRKTELKREKLTEKVPGRVMLPFESLFAPKKGQEVAPIKEGETILGVGPAVGRDVWREPPKTVKTIVGKEANMRRIQSANVAAMKLGLQRLGDMKTPEGKMIRDALSVADGTSVNDILVSDLAGLGKDTPDETDISTLADIARTRLQSRNPLSYLQWGLDNDVIDKEVYDMYAPLYLGKDKALGRTFDINSLPVEVLP